MMTMRNTHTTLLFTLCGLLFYGNGSSQIVVQEGNIAVQVNELAQRGDSLYVKMDVSTTGHNVGRTHERVAGNLGHGT